jgi:hypothetical protein
MSITPLPVEDERPGYAEDRRPLPPANYEVEQALLGAIL